MAYVAGFPHRVVMKYHVKGDTPFMMNDFAALAASSRPSVQVPLVDRLLTTEIAGDFSLPDYQPEIKRLLRIRADVLPSDRTGGGDEIGGVLDYYVLYMGHDNALYCAPLSTEYHMELPMENRGGESLSVGEPMVCLCDTTAETPIGRVTAPRRLNIRCKLNTHAMLYGECPLGADVRAEADAPTDLETLPGTADVGRVWSGVGEALPLQDDLILPPANGEWRVVCAEGAVLMTEASPSEGAVNCRGEVTLKLTLCPAESDENFASDAPGMGEASTLTILRRKIPFNQTVDMEGVPASCMATACGHCTDLSVQMEEGHVHVDLNVVTEARAQVCEQVPYVKDLYSTRRAGASHYATYPVEQAVRAINGNFTLSDSLPLDEVSIDPAAQVLDVTAEAVPAELLCDHAKGRCVLTGTCRAHLLLLRDGEYASADMELPFRYEFDDASRMGASEAPSEGNTPFDGSVSVHNCRARMDGERIALDAELGVSLRTRRPAPLTALADVSFGEDADANRRRGEYVICFPAPTDTLWSVAKRYHAPMAALTAANNLPAGAAADEIESLEGVGYLIV